MKLYGFCYRKVNSIILSPLLSKISNYLYCFLLNSGAIIDRLNSDNENCLDVSIARGHREVIRVLLNDPNWKKLIRVNNYDVHVNEDENLSASNLAANSLTIHSDHQSSVIDAKNVPHKVIECKSPFNQLIYNGVFFKIFFFYHLIIGPQLCALFDIKMWDSFKIILDKCILSEKEFDFTMIGKCLYLCSDH